MRAQLARVDAVIVQAVIAGALSFSHLHDLADAAGQGGWKAWAYPVSVDLLLVAAWRRMREQQRAGQAAGGARLWFLIALAASLGANVATAGLLDLDDVPASLRVVVAGWPAVAFFGGTLLAHTPRTPARPTDAETLPASAAVEEPQRDALPAPSIESKPAPEPAVEPIAAPAPTPTPIAPAVSLPPALIDRAQALAKQHRAATGLVADPDAVRARLGLPPSMTTAVAAHL
ncbi:DUF2637 domain-containing protein [Streptomyces hilarionis]|uniref:DUF2637 domain-containing protein n=1 Tax=Streptomyces hilarionis TaxID=2839954 RepID=UPI00211A5ADE|nr:DUF2637 domain-containing protein [Streptomyces hilarionis]MCQ9132665.1 DUF2637 domain-containing protein [Streptomyces hilarionis]